MLRGRLAVLLWRCPVAALWWGRLAVLLCRGPFGALRRGDPAVCGGHRVATWGPGRIYKWGQEDSAGADRSVLSDRVAWRFVIGTAKVASGLAEGGAVAQAPAVWLTESCFRSYE